MTPALRRVTRQMRHLRTERGLSQEALARKAGFSLGYTTRLENGRHDPPLSTLVKIATALKVPLVKLIG